MVKMVFPLYIDRVASTSVTQLKQIILLKRYIQNNLNLKLKTKQSQCTNDSATQKMSQYCTYLYLFMDHSCNPMGIADKQKNTCWN